MAEVIPRTVIAALEAVMARDLMHCLATNGVLHLWGAEGVMKLAEPDLFQQRHGASAECLATLVNDGRTRGEDRRFQVIECDRMAGVVETSTHQILN